MPSWTEVIKRLEAFEGQFALLHFGFSNNLAWGGPGCKQTSRVHPENDASKNPRRHIPSGNRTWTSRNEFRWISETWLIQVENSIKCFEQISRTICTSFGQEAKLLMKLRLGLSASGKPKKGSDPVGILWTFPGKSSILYHALQESFSLKAPVTLSE